jgi:hypothetical protein
MNIAPGLIFAASTLSLGAVLVARAFAAQTAPQQETLQVCDDPQPMPSGFDYPQAAATVEGWVTAGDESRARRHGWNLWAALNRPAPNGEPVWRSWCTSTYAYAPPPGAPAPAAVVSVASPTGTPHPASLNAKRQARGLVNGGVDGKLKGEPITFPTGPAYPIPTAVKSSWPACYDASSDSLKDGPVYQFEGNVMVAGIIYNRQAYDWIRSNGLYQGSVLDSWIESGTKVEAPAGSIVLKPMFWPVRGDGFSALPVWDDLKNDHDAYAGFEIQKMWKRAVAVTPLPTPVATTDVTYLYGAYESSKPNAPKLGPNTYRNAPVVPISRFYHSRPQLAGMHACDRAILDAASIAAYNRPFREGDYLALIAMHIMTKEQPAWTFQSLWWHDRPNDGPYATDRPALSPLQAPGPWRHYLMTSTYGIPAQPGGKTWPVAYNPYIELAGDHPIRSNCMNCHHRAAWPGKESSYEAPGGPGPLDIYKPGPSIFKVMLLDSQWSMSNRAGPSYAENADPPARRTDQR